VVTGPSFTGSRDVGGADADLIVGTCLVEVKTSTKPVTTQHTLQQVVAYALLDYDDEYAIDEVAIFHARRPAVARRSLGEVVHSLAGQPTNLGDLRVALAGWMQGDGGRI
jgi:hypothetical protein